MDMETKESLIEKIDYSECVLANMQVYQRLLKEANEHSSACYSWRSEIEKSKKAPVAYEESSKKLNKIVLKVFLFFVCYSLLAVAITYITKGDEDTTYKSVFFIMLAAVFVKYLIKRIIYETVKKPQLLKEADEDIEKAQDRCKEVEKMIADYAATDEWKTALSYVPKDYFYMSALEKFKYYLENGHADNMKEALKLYDEFVHRKKLEKEARRAADNSAEAAEYAKITSEKAANAEFWSLVNAYTTEEIYRKLN